MTPFVQVLSRLIILKKVHFLKNGYNAHRIILRIILEFLLIQY
eukprot:SAG31_NODE_5269_length_2640_cov_2.940181_1_plen_43_part_00